MQELLGKERIQEALISKTTSSCLSVMSLPDGLSLESGKFAIIQTCMVASMERASRDKECWESS
tara:strand:+ start:729 stop:920 length:192 start_codon:yes stop_codon:yes gene_type:complete